VKYCLYERDAATEQQPGDSAEIRRLFDEATDCLLFSQRVLRFPPGRSPERLVTASDEVLFVLDGTGTVAADGNEERVRRGTGVFVAAGTPWGVEARDELVAVSVLVHQPESAPARAAVVDTGDDAGRAATAGRQFRLGVGPEVGCSSVTQFVGVIPPGRAPDHFHTYDEVIYVLEGTGTLHLGGETAALEPAAAVHLPARLVHSLENTGAGDMLLLGVFRPAGSPAEAYYPDGTPAAAPEVS
jgi:quercetin dioxygenase-like cupin family protein